MNGNFMISVLILGVVAWFCHLLGISWVLGMLIGFIVFPVVVAWRNKGGGPPAVAPLVLLGLFCSPVMAMPETKEPPQIKEAMSENLRFAIPQAYSLPFKKKEKPRRK